MKIEAVATSVPVIKPPRTFTITITLSEAEATVLSVQSMSCLYGDVGRHAFAKFNSDLHTALYNVLAEK